MVHRAGTVNPGTPVSPDHSVTAEILVLKVRKDFLGKESGFVALLANAAYQEPRDALVTMGIPVYQVPKVSEVSKVKTAAFARQDDRVKRVNGAMPE